VKKIQQDELYQGFFELFTSCHFSPPLCLRKLKMELFRHCFYFVRSLQIDARHGGEECPAHAHGRLCENKEVNIHQKLAYVKCIDTHSPRH
jgi:hypothetical protein